MCPLYAAAMRPVPIALGRHSGFDETFLILGVIKGHRTSPPSTCSAVTYVRQRTEVIWSSLTEQPERRPFDVSPLSIEG
jgi:hypothetical protein